MIIRRLIYLVVMICIVSATVLSMSGCSEGEAGDKTARADLITIDVMKMFGKLERAPVIFQHDLHTSTLEERKRDCEICHQRTDKGNLSHKFMRLADNSKDEVMNIYHEECVDCHNETATAGLESGPTICGECHILEPAVVSSWVEIGFDKSLHHRHATAAEKDCGRCHHVYNEETKELEYVKGQESSCRDCHKDEAIDNTPALNVAAHTACIKCHLELGEEAGPYECAGCHNRERQMAIEKVAEPMRLERNQPDFVLLSASKEKLNDSKLRSVPFSHIGHEEFNNTCRVCHHESMKACKECHTLYGTEEGGGVTLQRAMHAMYSDHSCIGCHDRAKGNLECAGCHALMEQGRLSEHACPICHTGPEPGNLERVRSRYTSLSQFKPRAADVRLTFKEADIPDTVTINIIAEEYEPAVMPHRIIIDTLMKNIAGNKIATHFHGHEDVVCQGCHHHSPAGQKPPLCESCHGKPFDEQNPFLPGLYGAYHRQCIGCHEEMQLGKATDCTACHKEKAAGL
jgi:hypothetical protein